MIARKNFLLEGRNLRQTLAPGHHGRSLRSLNLTATKWGAPSVFLNIWKWGCMMVLRERSLISKRSQIPISLHLHGKDIWCISYVYVNGECGKRVTENPQWHCGSVVSMTVFCLLYPILLPQVKDIEFSVIWYQFPTTFSRNTKHWFIIILLLESLN